MNIGTRRASVTIQERDYSGADAFGEGFSYITVHDGWRADKIAKNARQFFSDARTNADADYLLIGGYRDGVTPDMRALIGGETFDIVGVFDPDNMRRTMHVMVKQRISPEQPFND